MTKYIQIRNMGEVEVEGFKLIGASTKKDDESKIGFFGSGIKYTISYFLRNSLFLKVYSGLAPINFELKEVTLRGKSFNKVLVNGEETSICTELGAHWKRWQIFREIVTNAFDEDNFDITLTEAINPIPGLTTFYLIYEDFKEYYDNLSTYFRSNLVKDNEPSIIVKEHPGPLNVFKRGVRVIDEKGYGKDSLISLFDYNFVDIDLNEERVASLWEVRYNITNFLTRLSDKEHLQIIYNAILDNKKELFEVQEVFANMSEYQTLSSEWLSVLNSVESKVLPDGHQDFLIEEKGETFVLDNNIKFIPTPFVETIKRSFGDEFKGSFKSSELDEDFFIVETKLSQQSLINESIQALKNKGIFIDCPISLAKFKSSELKTLYKNETIYLSEQVLESNKILSTCVKLLVESFIKYKYKVKDNSKEMQETCIEVIAGLIMT